MSGIRGRGGRPPKPAEIKRAEGNRAKVARKDMPVPVKMTGAPIMPDYFTGEAVTLWRLTLKSMPSGVLSQADTSVVERFVSAWANLRQCRRQLAEEGLMVRRGTRGKTLVRNPLLPLIEMMSREMTRTGSEIGLSPSARARLATSRIEDEDDGDEALLLGMAGGNDGGWRKPN